MTISIPTIRRSPSKLHLFIQFNSLRTIPSVGKSCGLEQCVTENRAGIRFVGSRNSSTALQLWPLLLDGRHAIGRGSKSRWILTITYNWSGATTSGGIPTGFLGTTPIGESGGVFTHVDPNLKRPYSDEISVSYQKQLWRDLVVGAAYISATRVICSAKKTWLPRPAITPRSLRSTGNRS